jgi:hypothetical protein
LLDLFFDPEDGGDIFLRNVVTFIELNQDMDQWRALFNTAMNLRVP